MRRLGAFLAALIACWLGLVQPATATPRTAAIVITYTYDVLHASISVINSFAERGPPTASDEQVGARVVNAGAHGTAGRSHRSGSVATGSTYDHSARFVQFGGGSTITNWADTSVLKAPLSDRGGGSVAANRGLVGGITRLSADEVTTGTRLARLHPERTFSESQHVGAEFVDDLGRSYDALGTPAASQYWNEPQFLRSIDAHLLKSNDFTVIDLTGFTSSQVSTVRTYLSELSSAQQAAIIRVGF